VLRFGITCNEDSRSKKCQRFKSVNCRAATMACGVVAEEVAARDAWDCSG
jgi:hypothetical protein